MNIKPLHPNFRMPSQATDKSGGFDLYMPEGGRLFPHADFGVMVGLGFAAAIPEGHVALLLPRSGAGSKQGLELNNTCGVIDADYRGEWKASLRIKNNKAFKWDAGDRILQAVIVPVAQVTLRLVEDLDETERGEGGFGHTGK